MKSTAHQLSDQPMDNLAHHVTEATAGLASKASIGTGITAMLVGGIGLQDWLMIIGIATTVGTFVVNWFYQHRRTASFVQPCTADETCGQAGKGRRR